ncbi:hypothetical protein [Microbacterium laevaniformans]|uniref:hypothetical protein n=1 Tax=Microbacterium laevaniformans TaxID=36807 RepID=UPI003D962DD6
MTLRSEIEQMFNDAQEEVNRRSTPAGVMGREGDPDMRFVMINETFAAIHKSLLLIADRLDEAQVATQAQ